MRRDVEPQAMLILPLLWCLVVWGPARDDFQRFSMDRIIKPDIVAGRKFGQRHVPFDKDVWPLPPLVAM